MQKFPKNQFKIANYTHFRETNWKVSEFFTKMSNLSFETVQDGAVEACECLRFLHLVSSFLTFLREIHLSSRHWGCLEKSARKFILYCTVCYTLPFRLYSNAWCWSIERKSIRARFALSAGLTLRKPKVACIRLSRMSFPSPSLKPFNSCFPLIFHTSLLKFFYV